MIKPFKFILSSRKKGHYPIELSFDWNQCNSSDFSIIKKFLIDAFLNAYKHCSAEELELTPDLTKEKFLENIFNHQVTAIETGKCQYLIARINDKVVGFAGCSTNYRNGNLYLDLLAVHPDFMSYGIGKGIINALKERFPHLNGIDLATRVVNEGAQSFYAHCHFKETSSLAEIEPELVGKPYIGMEYLYREHRDELPVSFPRSRSTQNLRSSWQNYIKEESNIAKIRDLQT